MDQANKKNSKCRDCYIKSMKAMKATIPERLCPSCGKILQYKTKMGYNEAIKINSKCKSCSNKGPLSVRFGMKVPEEIKLKSSKTWFKKGQRPLNADFRLGKSLKEIYGEQRAESILKKYHQRKQSENSNILRSISCKKAGCGRSNKGRKCSDKNRKKFRSQMMERLKATKQNFHPGYNKKGCEFFDKLMLFTGTNIQHALNGGELCIEELGYWVDGYDKINNIIYEFDEKYRHYDVYGNLNEKDGIKQKEIMELLNCKFIRIKWNETDIDLHLFSIKNNIPTQ